MTEGKPILERMRRGGWWRDQLWHWLIPLVGSAAISILLDWQTPLPDVLCAYVGQVVALLAGFARELIQNWGDEPERGSVEDSTLDMGFWALGSVTGGLVVLAPF